ncbi:copper amine oxidase N-terminal domain-containing protein [Clostridiaceae bacterium M8S5]|nr:copper amine oxidase N-terminal domain-containing protein [Clostridiaceae bacterium M8S5]
MLKLKRTILVSFAVLMLVVAPSSSYGKASIYYESKDSLFLKQDDQITKINKDLKHEQEYITKEEKEKIINNKKNYEIEGQNVNKEDIKIVNNLLYVKNQKLLDISEYNDYNDRFYDIYEGENNHEDRTKEREASNRGRRLKLINLGTGDYIKREPLAISINKYELEDGKELYCVFMNVAATPRAGIFSNIVIAEGENVFAYELGSDFRLSGIYSNKLGIFITGINSYSPTGIHTDGGCVIHVYKSNNDYKVDYIKDKIEEVYSYCKFMLAAIREDKVIFMGEPIKDTKSFYELNKVGNIVKRNEIIKKNSYGECYIDDNNQIYYIDSKGVSNITTGKFIELRKHTRIKHGDEYIKFNSDKGYPFIDKNSRTQVPLRVTMEQLGATVEWNQDTKKAIVTKGNTEVEVKIGEKYIFKNGVKIESDTKAIIVNDRIYLPIRIVMEAFNQEVSFDKDTNTVVIEGK